MAAFVRSPGRSARQSQHWTMVMPRVDILWPCAVWPNRKSASPQPTYVSPWPIATLYTRAGMPDEALGWLEKALEAHDPNMPYLSIDPIFDYMREDPRFQILLTKVGL